MLFSYLILSDLDLDLILQLAGRRLRCLNSLRTYLARVRLVAPFECDGVSLRWCVWVPGAYRVWQRVW